jgi:glucosamine-6-phosphate deaminase
MQIIKTKDYGELSKRAADILIKEIRKNPSLTLGSATGSTPLGMYKILVRANKSKKVDFSNITSINLDEYYKIKRKDKNSYYFAMHKNLFDKVNIKPENLNFFNSEAKNPGKECKDYETKIKNKPIDIQILGVGVNGHIGFNEPGSSFNSKTRLIKLTQQTIDSNSRFFKNKSQVPKLALTLGISTILRAKKIILLASGKNKSEAIKQLVDGKINSRFPVTFLKKHRNLIVIADRAALGKVKG